MGGHHGDPLAAHIAPTLAPRDESLIDLFRATAGDLMSAEEVDAVVVTCAAMDLADMSGGLAECTDCFRPGGLVDHAMVGQLFDRAVERLAAAKATLDGAP